MLRKVHVDLQTSIGQNVEPTECRKEENTMKKNNEEKNTENYNPSKIKIAKLYKIECFLKKNKNPTNYLRFSSL